MAKTGATARRHRRPGTARSCGPVRSVEEPSIRGRNRHSRPRPVNGTSRRYGGNGTGRGNCVGDIAVVADPVTPDTRRIWTHHIQECPSTRWRGKGYRPAEAGRVIYHANQQGADGESGLLRRRRLPKRRCLDKKRRRGHGPGDAHEVVSDAGQVEQPGEVVAVVERLPRADYDCCVGRHCHRRREASLTDSGTGTGRPAPSVTAIRNEDASKALPPIIRSSAELLRSASANTTGWLSGTVRVRVAVKVKGRAVTLACVVPSSPSGIPDRAGAGCIVAVGTTCRSAGREAAFVTLVVAGPLERVVTAATAASAAIVSRVTPTMRPRAPPLFFRILVPFCMVWNCRRKCSFTRSPTDQGAELRPSAASGSQPGGNDAPTGTSR